MQVLVSKAAVVAYSSAALIGLSLLTAACGDDDPTPDAGGMDGGMAGSGGSRPRDGGFIRPTDGQTTIGDPIPECDRWDPSACAAGERCHVLIRLRPGAMNFEIYTGCVEDGIVRGEGDPCDPWNGGAQPYKTEGLEDEVHVDPCGEGLICGANRAVRGSFSCQRACESRRMGCSGEGDYCTGDPRGLEQFCRTADNCDPSNPTACGAGSGCYLWPSDRGDGFVTVCAQTIDEPVADGVACDYVNHCNPGSSCWGPARQPPALWTTMTELTCQRSCIVGSVAEDDAGVDDDAGVGGGGCRGGLTCESFTEAGLELGDLGIDLGQCE